MQSNFSYKRIIKTSGQDPFTRSSPQIRDALVHRCKVHQIKHSVSHEAIKQSEMRHIQRDKRCSHVQIVKNKTRSRAHIYGLTSSSVLFCKCTRQWYMPAYVTFPIIIIKTNQLIECGQTRTGGADGRCSQVETPSHPDVCEIKESPTF